MIYLDYQATTPLAPEAREAMLRWLDPTTSANPHSPHVPGRAAKAAVEFARDQVAALLPPGGRTYFTSGATEAANWALRGCGARSIAVSAIEHACVLDTADALASEGVAVDRIEVDREGMVDPASVPPARLIAVMLVNNEIGTIQPVAEIARTAHAAGSLVFCDAVQAYGRIAMPGGCDMIAISAHKIHGPKGIGALWVRDGVELAPLLHGGGQEGGLRAGTLSPALCAGFGAAAALAAERIDVDRRHVDDLRQTARERLDAAWVLNGSAEHRWHGNLNIRRDGLDASRLISSLRRVAFSAGSACASGSGRASHVLRAIGLDEAQARSSIRIGFGRYTKKDELLEAIDLLDRAAQSQMIAAA